MEGSSRQPIEITPEMVEAGLVVLRRYDWEPDEMDKDEVVKRILTAALLTRANFRE